MALVFALKRFAHDNEGKPGRLDLVGAVTSTIAIGLLLIAIDRSVSAGWGDTFTIASLVGSAVLLVLFIYIQARVELPLMPLRLFASVERSGAYAARLLFIGANMAFYFYISQFMQGVLGVNAAFAGVAFLPSTIVNFITAMVVARFIIRFGSAPVLIVTVTCGLLGMATLSFVSPTSTYWAALLIPTMLVGIGQGGSLAPLTTAALADVAKEDAGAASGIINVAHQMGASLGIGVATSYAASVDTSLSGAGLMTERVHLAMSAASVMVFLSLVMVLAIIMQRRKRGARQKL